MISNATPLHLVACWLGILNGLGCDYKLDFLSPFYEEMKEKKRQRFMELLTNGEIGDELPAELGKDITIKAGDPDSIKATMRPLWIEGNIWTT